jgi:hypothetical protein
MAAIGSVSGPQSDTGNASVHWIVRVRSRDGCRLVLKVLMVFRCVGAQHANPTNRKSTMVATNDIGAEVATLLTGPVWSGQRVVELGSMVTADQVAEQLGEVLKLDVKAFAVPRAGWAEAFDVRTRCLRGGPEGRQGVRPGRIRHERNCVLAECAWRIVQALASRDGLSAGRANRDGTAKECRKSTNRCR